MNEEKKVSTDGAKPSISTKAPIFWLLAYGVVWAIVLVLYLSHHIFPLIEEDYPCASYGYGWSIALFFITAAGLVMELLILLPVFFLYMKRRWSWALAIVLLQLRLSIEVVFVILILIGFKDVFFALLFFGLGIVLLRSLKMVIQYRDIYSEMLR